MIFAFYFFGYRLVWERGRGVRGGVMGGDVRNGVLNFFGGQRFEARGEIFDF